MQSRWAHDGSWIEGLMVVVVGGPALAITWLILGSITAARLMRQSRLAPRAYIGCSNAARTTRRRIFD